MRIGVLIIILFTSALNAQSDTFKEVNCIIDYNSKSEKDFIIKVKRDDVYNDSSVSYNKIKISHFGEFYIAKVDDIFFSSLGSTTENEVSIWLGEDGQKEKMFEIGKEKQNLGYPFRGYRAYYNQVTSNGLQIYDIVKADCYSLDNNPYELKRILLLNGIINQLVFREKFTETCYYTTKK